MRKRETLRGRGAFRELVERGDRLEGTLVRCSYVLRSSEGTPVFAGFTVSSRKYGAVRRNRIRRMMRAGFDRERDQLLASLATSAKAVSMVFIFKGKKGVDVRRLKLHPIHQDIARICRGVAAKL